MIFNGKGAVFLCDVDGCTELFSSLRDLRVHRLRDHKNKEYKLCSIHHKQAIADSKNWRLN